MIDHLSSSHEEGFHIFFLLIYFFVSRMESQGGNGKKLSRQTGKGESHTVSDLLVRPAARRGKITPACMRRCLVIVDFLFASFPTHIITYS